MCYDPKEFDKNEPDELTTGQIFEAMKKDSKAKIDVQLDQAEKKKIYPTAKEAREQATKIRQAKINTQYDLVMYKIKKAIDNGDLEIEYHELMSEVIDKLKEWPNRYRIECIDEIDKLYKIKY